MNSTADNVVVSGDIELDYRPFLIKYTDGRIQRWLSSPFVAASENPTGNRGVATRDVVIDAGTGLSARLFLPSKAAAMARSGRLPLVVYFHGGSFSTESAFCRTYHRYATSLAASAAAVVVSVEYRLAPEHLIPAAYDDAWAALQWVASLSDPWLADHADTMRTFLVGDSAGGNIVYHTTVRASRDRNINIEGMVMVHPYFWGAQRLPSETAGCDDGNGMAAVFPPDVVDLLWPFVAAGRAGNDDPRVNPPDEEISALTCHRVLVAVAQKDTLRDRGYHMLARIRDCASKVRMTQMVESEGEDHGFHLYHPLRATSKKLMESIVNFINQPASPPSDLEEEEEEEEEEIDAWGWEGLHAATTHCPIVLGVPSRPFRDIFDYGMDMKRFTGMACRAYRGPFKVGRGNLAAFNKVNYGLFVAGPFRPNKAYKGPATAALPSTRVVKNVF